MKRFILLFSIMILSLFTSCNKSERITDVDIDADCVGILVFSIVDKNGYDLLNPERPNNIISNSSLTYKNKNYRFTNTSPLKLPEPVPQIFGLQTTLGRDGIVYYIFGQWDEGGDTEEEFKIDINDTTSHIVKVVIKWTTEVRDKKRYPVYNRYVYVDGKEYKSDYAHITIVY